ncbi:uncharacterized protein LOC124796361 isoform X1 [Schistocerca piceifrons]|uniref:uncharacterized protein LOC124796361 isoform X1 n=2 Tax=Schistocerca piceifrons TaxID=274613 RepID=UPI001F5EAB96|nr:uncharacterized protein LOC124796361 isoform X1 [Schistocerca piceifrons]
MKIKDRSLLLTAACGLVQSVTWFVLALLGVLVYKCAIDLPDEPDAAALFGTRLAQFYLAGDECAMSNRSQTVGLTPPEGLLIINSIIIATSVLWVVASSLLVWEAVRVMEQRRSWVLWSWVTITGFICLSDLGIFINFSVDYSNTVSRIRSVKKIQKSLGLEPWDVETMLDFPTPGLELLTYSAFMMSMAARGYVLWLLNVAAALWVGFQALGGGCHADDQDERKSLKHHFLTSLYSDRRDKPDGVSSPWAVQSPVVGTAPRPLPWSSFRSAPTVEIPRPFRLGPPPPGRPRTNAIPEPDYDNESLSREPPQLSREPPQLAREPSRLAREPPYLGRSPPHAKDALRREPPPLDEMPRRSALKKATSPESRFAGKTVF